MYVIDAPRVSGISTAHSIDPGYVDSEMWFEPYIDTYDRKGELWQNHIYLPPYRDRPVPDAQVAIYPFKREFIVGAVSTDVQSLLATMCYLPVEEYPERECWYINMGASRQGLVHHRGRGEGGRGRLDAVIPDLSV